MSRWRLLSVRCSRLPSPSSSWCLSSWLSSCPVPVVSFALQQLVRQRYAERHRIVHRPVRGEPPYAVVLAERAPEPELGAVLTLDHLGERSDRSRTPCLERGHQLPFRRHRGPGGRVLQRSQGGQHLGVVRPALDAQGTLSRRGQNL